MRDVANAAVGRAVLPEEKVVMHTRPSGINVYYSAEGLADSETGHTECQDGPAFIGRTGVIDALKEGPDNLWFSPATVVYQPDPWVRRSPWNRWSPTRAWWQPFHCRIV